MCTENVIQYSDGHLLVKPVPCDNPQPNEFCARYQGQRPFALADSTEPCGVCIRLADRRVTVSTGAKDDVKPDWRLRSAPGGRWQYRRARAGPVIAVRSHNKTPQPRFVSQKELEKRKKRRKEEAEAMAKAGCERYYRLITLGTRPTEYHLKGLIRCWNTRCRCFFTPKPKPVKPPDSPRTIARKEKWEDIRFILRVHNIMKNFDPLEDEFEKMPYSPNWDNRQSEEDRFKDEEYTGPQEFSGSGR